MILQALHADKRLKELEKQGRIIIKSSDTDVIVLCINFDKQMTNISELWLQMGNVSSVKDGRRFLHLEPQFTNVCHLLIKINTENNHICIRGFDNDPALLFQFFEPFVSM
jgi:hypothetical protein